MFVINYINAENFSVTYDKNFNILIVRYKGLLNSQVTQSYYHWLIDTVRSNQQLLHSTRGSIYDFRAVTGFQSTNMITARRESQGANQNIDVKNHPVALLVENAEQESTVKLLMQLTEQSERKKIVYSMEEAHTFIHDWHQKAINQ